MFAKGKGREIKERQHCVPCFSNVLREQKWKTEEEFQQIVHALYRTIIEQVSLQTRLMFLGPDLLLYG